MKLNIRKKLSSLWQPDNIKEFWLWTDPTHTIIAKIKKDVLIIAQKRSEKQEKVDASGSTLFPFTDVSNHFTMTLEWLFARSGHWR